MRGRSFLDMKSVAVFVNEWECYTCLLVTESLRFFTAFAVKKRFCFGGFMENKKYTREDCILLMNEKYAELKETGLSRYPQRSDFDAREVVAIKALLGPWPRALEAAGIKPPPANI